MVIDGCLSIVSSLSIVVEDCLSIVSSLSMVVDECLSVASGCLWLLMVVYP